MSSPKVKLLCGNVIRIPDLQSPIPQPIFQMNNILSFGFFLLCKGAFKYYVITFLAFLGPPTYLFDDLQYCKSSKIAIF